jgi:hypothetical protein
MIGSKCHSLRDGEPMVQAWSTNRPETIQGLLS